MRSPPAHLPASQTPPLLTTSCTPQPNQLLAHDASRPWQRRRTRRQRTQGRHPSLAEASTSAHPAHHASSRTPHPPAPPAATRSQPPPARSLLADAWVGGLQIHLGHRRLVASAANPSPGPTLEVHTIEYIMRDTCFGTFGGVAYLSASRASRLSSVVDVEREIWTDTAAALSRDLSTYV